MKENILYHGSASEIYEPDLDKCSRYRDFGKCFYLTYNEKMANDWVKTKDKDHPVVNEYTIDFSAVESGKLRIKRFKADGEWAKFIYNNRYNEKYKRPAYDIIIGPLNEGDLFIFETLDKELKQNLMKTAENVRIMNGRMQGE